jgi:hypothetical protein
MITSGEWGVKRGRDKLWGTRGEENRRSNIGARALISTGYFGNMSFLIGSLGDNPLDGDENSL